MTYSGSIPRWVIWLELLILVLCLVLLLHLNLLLSKLCNAILDDAEMPQDVVLARCQLVGMLEARLSLQQSATFDVYDA